MGSPAPPGETPDPTLDEDLKRRRAEELIIGVDGNVGGAVGGGGTGRGGAGVGDEDEFEEIDDFGSPVGDGHSLARDEEDGEARSRDGDGVRVAEGGVRVFSEKTWGGPWVWRTGTGWRADIEVLGRAVIELMVLMHKDIGTIIEIQPGEPSGFIFKVCSKGDTPQNTPGNTPRLPHKIKRCSHEGYVGDWRFNGTDLVQQISLQGGNPIYAKMEHRAWRFIERDPEKAAREVFQSFDTDGGGTMDAAEIKEAAKAMGFILSDIDEIPEEGVDLQGFLDFLGIKNPECCMVLTVRDNDMEVWLTRKGFIFLSSSHRDEAFVAQGGVCPDYTVPKLEAWQWLPKADQALKQADVWRMEKQRQEEAEREAEEQRQAAERALRAKDDEEEAKRRRRALREQGIEVTFENKASM